MKDQTHNAERAAFVRALKELQPVFGLRLDERVLSGFAAHYELLREWNRKMNLTSLIDPVQAARFHYLESLYAIRHFRPRIRSVIDVGSGAGFPGFPIAIYAPALRVVLVERQMRKVVFLRLAAQQLQMKNLSVFHGQFQDYRARDFDLILCRALDRFQEQLPELLQFGSMAKQILIFAGHEIAKQCRLMLPDRWRLTQHELPLSQRRVLLSLWSTGFTWNDPSSPTADRNPTGFT